VTVEHSDEALVEETCAGSTNAFEEIMRRYERLVYVTGFAYAGNREDALDITQSVFVKVYEKLGSYRGTGTFKAWLLRIAHNESLNWIRDHARHSDHDELAPGNAPEFRASQESDLVEKRKLDLVRKALVQLNPRQQQAIVLRYFEQSSTSEIARVLGCTEGTAKNILFRGLEKLRRQLVPHWRES
jgi:RNA polymerase sigma-70 factor (ECF subfamily)